jgi:hypothetical protein
LIKEEEPFSIDCEILRSGASIAALSFGIEVDNSDEPGVSF